MNLELAKRPAIDLDELCPVTLRWIAEEHIADSHRCYDKVDAAHHRSEARRLRTLATRVERHQNNVKGGE